MERKYYFGSMIISGVLTIVITIILINTNFHIISGLALFFGILLIMHGILMCLGIDLYPKGRHNFSKKSKIILGIAMSMQGVLWCFMSFTNYTKEILPIILSMLPVIIIEITIRIVERKRIK